MIDIPKKHAATEASEAVADHPNRHIREALKYAEEQGWTIRKFGPHAHAWGIIFCSFGHRACWMAIYSTPKNSEKPRTRHSTYCGPVRRCITGEPADG